MVLQASEAEAGVRVKTFWFGDDGSDSRGSGQSAERVGVHVREVSTHAFRDFKSTREYCVDFECVLYF